MRQRVEKFAVSGRLFEYNIMTAYNKSRCLAPSHLFSQGSRSHHVHHPIPASLSALQLSMHYPHSARQLPMLLQAIQLQQKLTANPVPATSLATSAPAVRSCDPSMMARDTLVTPRRSIRAACAMGQESTMSRTGSISIAAARARPSMWSF